MTSVEHSARFFEFVAATNEHYKKSGGYGDVTIKMPTSTKFDPVLLSYLKDQSSEARHMIAGFILAAISRGQTLSSKEIAGMIYAHTDPNPGSTPSEAAMVVSPSLVPQSPQQYSEALGSDSPDAVLSNYRTFVERAAGCKSKVEKFSFEDGLAISPSAIWPINKAAMTRTARAKFLDSIVGGRLNTNARLLSSFNLANPKDSLLSLDGEKEKIVTFFKRTLLIYKKPQYYDTNKTLVEKMESKKHCCWGSGGPGCLVIMEGLFVNSVSVVAWDGRFFSMGYSTMSPISTDLIKSAFARALVVGIQANYSVMGYTHRRSSKKQENYTLISNTKYKPKYLKRGDVEFFEDLHDVGDRRIPVMYKLASGKVNQLATTTAIPVAKDPELIRAKFAKIASWDVQYNSDGTRARMSFDEAFEEIVPVVSAFEEIEIDLTPIPAVPAPSSSSSSSPAPNPIPAPDPKKDQEKGKSVADPSTDVLKGTSYTVDGGARLLSQRTPKDIFQWGITTSYHNSMWIPLYKASSRALIAAPYDFAKMTMADFRATQKYDYTFKIPSDLITQIRLTDQFYIADLEGKEEDEDFVELDGSEIPTNIPTGDITIPPWETQKGVYTYWLEFGRTYFPIRSNLLYLATRVRPGQISDDDADFTHFYSNILEQQKMMDNDNE